VTVSDHNWSLTHSHQISFNGSLWFGTAPEGSPPTLVLVGPGMHVPELEARVFGSDVIAVECERRPNQRFVLELAEQARAGQVRRLAAMGDGALLDAAKLAVRDVESRAQEPVELVLVPCGAEPYRAVTRFAVVDDGDSRPTVVDERFGRACVVLVPELLELVPRQTLACHALDSAVHAIESLLSNLANPYSRALAMASLRTLAEAARDRDPTSIESRTRFLAAAFLAAEAFSSTRLGLAHAIASPLGTSLRITHDVLNGVLGERVVSFWGSGVRGFYDIASALDLAPTPDAICSWLAMLREAADLPPSLRDLDIPWASVEAILPDAARSSGVAVLPRRLPKSGLGNFARLAWAGSVDEEVLHAGRR
jgi:alcohol dehydrogenase class IV